MNTLTQALEAMKVVCGIYRMTNTQTGKFYIGSSVDIRGRWYKHLSHLRRGIHANAHLQAAFTQSGEDAFLFQLVEACEPGALLALEQYHIDCAWQREAETLSWLHPHPSGSSPVGAQIGGQQQSAGMAQGGSASA